MGRLRMGQCVFSRLPVVPCAQFAISSNFRAGDPHSAQSASVGRKARLHVGLHNASLDGLG